MVEAFGVTDFIRLRAGVGRPVGNGVDYVLGPFTQAEREQVPDIVHRAADAVERLTDLGLERAMTDINNG